VRGLRFQRFVGQTDEPRLFICEEIESSGRRGRTARDFGAGRPNDAKQNSEAKGDGARKHNYCEQGLFARSRNSLESLSLTAESAEFIPFPACAGPQRPHNLCATHVMPKRTDLKSILIIGAGPIVIGRPANSTIPVPRLQGAQEEGYRVILVNSNPATIMTDPEFADVTYIEPLTLECSRKSSRSNVPPRFFRPWVVRPR